jgi:copper resistance protein D
MEHLLFNMSTAVDLLALVTCLGTLSCRLWVLSPPATGEDAAVLSRLHAALWRLLGGCLLALTMSSTGELLGRTLTMSGLPLAMLGHTLPIVLLRTHYGCVWFVRLGALAILWIGWGVARRHQHARTVPAGMLVAAGIIALTRSLSGHAADWGDITPAVMMDGLHLLAGGLWGGGLLALTSVVLPAVHKCADQQRVLLATCARRFATLASRALAVVLLTGCANAWIQVGSVSALWATPYGLTLLAKLVLVCLVLLIGAVNHYIYVPLLQQWAGRQVTEGWLLHVPRLWQILPTRWQLPVGPQTVHHWWRTIVLESLLLGGVLLCTVLLLHATPARSPSHIMSGHGGTVAVPAAHGH